MTRTLPHLKNTVERGEVLHVQGISAAGALTLCALAMGRLIGARVVYSPHDTFSRRGQIDAAFLRLALHLPNALIVHSHADAKAVDRMKLRAHFSPLIQLIPSPQDLDRNAWRIEWVAPATTDVVLFAGCIRPEKRLDLLIESAADWPPSRKLAVVGEDRGAWAHCRRLARSHGVDVAAKIEFVSLRRFVAAISAADLVVAPHSKASQSGVLSVASQLGVPTVAADVGGLAELASETFVAGDAKDLARAIDRQLSKANLPGVAVDEDLAVAAHLSAYQLGSDARAKGSG
jgi:glycosyltransferase involved in cell wall biosynthesis